MTKTKSKGKTIIPNGQVSKKKSVKVNREDLLLKLKEVQPGLSPKEILEQSNCYAFGDGYVFTFNEEMACRTKSGLPKWFRGAVKARPLFSLLSRMKEDEVELELSSKAVSVKGIRRGADIVIEAEVLLPIDKVELPKEWKKLSGDFADAITIVQECAGKDEHAVKSTCIHITPNWIEACDNLQLTRYAIKTPVQENILVKQASIKYVPMLDFTEFSETKNWIHFRGSSGLILSCHRFVEEYPDLGKMLAVSGTPTVFPKALIDDVENAEIFSSEDKDNNKVIVEIRPGKMRVTGIGDSGKYWAFKDIKYGGEPMKFLVSPRLFNEIVKRSSRCEISKKHRLKVNGGKFQYVACLDKS